MIGEYRPKGTIGVLLGCWLTVFSFLASAQQLLDLDSALQKSQTAVGNPVGELTLVDTRGRSIALSSLRGKPLLVSMIYTSCPDVCSLITKQLSELVVVARDALGNDSFTVLSVGFDAGVDTPDRLRQYAKSQGVRPDDNWLFVTGDPSTIDAMTRALGFSYIRSPRGYDHVAQVSVLDAEHRVYRQVYGQAIVPPKLVEPLKELVFGERSDRNPIQGWVDGVRLLCTIYDPATGRYTFDYSVFVSAVIGAACLGGIAYFLIGSWRSHRRSSPS